MQVMHVMASGARGGGADHLLGLLPALSRCGVACAAATDEDGPLLAELHDRGVAAERLALMGLRYDPRAAAGLCRFLRRHRPDIVHYHGTRAAFHGALARTMASVSGDGPSAVYSVHGLSFRKELGALRLAAFQAAERLACAAADHVVSVSRFDLIDLQRRGYLALHKATHVPNAVEVERFGRVTRWKARTAFGIDETAKVVGTVSRLVPQKCVSDLVQAMRWCPSALLVVVGGGPEGAAIAALARRHGVRLQLLGERADVPNILPAFDIFALSSRWEGEPIALLEAMASGLPCVATATAGSREILEGQGCGVLVPIADPRRLGGTLAHLLAQPDECARLGRRGRKAVASRTFERQAKSIATIYHRLVN